MKPAPFDYVRAESLEHALSALADGGGDAKPLAGGQSLVPALNMRIVRPTLLVDLNHAGLDGIETTSHALRVGATVRQATLEHDERAHPLLRDALPHVGHFVTRNRGTIGGSIAHADGAAELPLCLVALGGTVTADGPGGRREITADDFFVTHYSTTLQPAELVIETAWPSPAAHEGSAFEESALRAGDYGLSMVAVVLCRDDGAARAVRVAVGAVSERPLLLTTAADELEGRPIGEREARAAGAAAASALEPLDSIHASSGYLRSITATLVARAALRAWEAAA